MKSVFHFGQSSTSPASNNFVETILKVGMNQDFFLLKSIFLLHQILQKISLKIFSYMFLS